jgi:hypothetical protein
MRCAEVVTQLRGLASSLGANAEGSEWYLFGSILRDDAYAADIDLMVLCGSDEQADSLRRAIDPDCLGLPIHLAFLTYREAAEVSAVQLQNARPIFPMLFSETQVFRARTTIVADRSR